MADPSPVDPAPVELTALSDRALLRMFLQKSDDDAFRVLVERHAALVLGVCRRGLHSAADADDAFQATFVVLARSARRIRRRESLGAWLYGVATRVCHRSRRDTARRATFELMDVATEQKDPLDELLTRHDETVADEELNALPESLRTPLVLRYLAGKSNDDVADELGITVAALEGRLKRGKQRLRMRLLRRGVTLAAVVAVLKATRVAACDVPASLVGSTAEICSSAACATISSLASESTTATHFALQELNIMNTLIVSKPLVAAFAVSGVAALALTAQLAFSQGEPSPGNGADIVLNAANVSDDASPFDLSSDEETPLRIVSDQDAGTGAFSDSNSELAGADAFGDFDSELAGTGEGDPLLETGLEDGFVTNTSTVRDLKPRTPNELLIEATLPRPLNTSGLDFSGTPLDEVVEFLQSEYNLPILIDSRALDDVGIAWDEPITAKLHNIKLESALRIMLRPLDLTYTVKDEMLLITSEDVAESQLEARVYPTHFLNVSSGSVKQLLLETVAPNTWEEQGGNGTSSAQFNDRLIIRQTYAVHQEINALLSQLKNSTDNSGDPVYGSDNSPRN
ncbi:MAG: sigma-70 family RNA polymerase sigma factor [Aeoliella sp.]